MPRTELMLLDAPSLYFRAFHGVPTTVTGPHGRPTNAVRGLLDATATLVRSRRPRRVVACLDADWRPAFRVAALPEYKAHRVGPDGGDQTPPELAEQVPVIEAVLAAVGFAVVGAPGFEADDVVATLAGQATGPVDVVTGDRDLFQLVRDDVPVRVLYPAKGVTGPVAVDEAEIHRRYGIPGRAYAEFALLRGDPSDGLPGVRGVGEKTAAALISRYGTVAAVQAAAEAEDPAVPAAVRARIRGAASYLAAARPVVLAERDVPLPPVDGSLDAVPADPERLVRLSEEHGLDGPLNRLLDAVRASM